MNVEASEVYPNAPIRRVALEVRFPEGPGTRMLGVPAQRVLRDKLGSDWVIESIRQGIIGMGVSPAGPIHEPMRTVVWPCFLIRDRTVGVTVMDTAVTIETTRYHQYATFRPFAERVMGAIQDVMKPEGVERVGLRYIDELREMPGIDKDDPQGWRAWVDSQLLGPHLNDMTENGYQPGEWVGLIQYKVGQDQLLQFQYGPRPGPISYPDGPLRRPVVPDRGPWFLMDFDASWTPQDIPEFAVDTVMSVCDELRKPIKRLFELVTPAQLRRHYQQGENEQ